MTFKKGVSKVIMPGLPTKAPRDSHDQPLPAAGNYRPDVQGEVIKDLQKRWQIGIERYGQGLKPLNGRNTALDAYEEALDMAVYLKSLVYELDILKKALGLAAIDIIFKHTEPLSGLENAGQVIEHYIHKAEMPQ